MLSFTFKITCVACHTVLTYQDERPEWKTFDYRVECAEQIERAYAFAEKHAQTRLPVGYQELTDVWSEITEGEIQAFIGLAKTDDGFRARVTIPNSYRYIDCPVCDEKIVEPNSEWGR